MRNTVWGHNVEWVMTIPYVKKCRKRNVQSADQKTHELFANDVPDIMNRFRTKLTDGNEVG